MSFESELIKPTSKKISLVEFDVGENLNKTTQEWTKFEPGIWYLKYHNPLSGTTVDFSYGQGAYGYYRYGDSGTTESKSYRNKVFIAGSFLADSISYSEVSTIANLRSTNQSWYFDYDLQILYVHFNNYSDPYDYNTLTFGITTGYSTTGGFYNNVYYAGRIKSLPNISISRDPLNFGVLSYKDLTISLDNTDGAFDDFNNLDIYGQTVRIKLGFEGNTYSEFRTVYTGYFSQFQLIGNFVKIKTKDDRARLKRKVPVNSLDTTTYPNLSDDNIGQIIPLGYGAIKKAIAYCTNDDEVAPANYNFKFIDTTYHSIQSINQVYVNNVAKAHINPSIANGTFDIAVANYTPGDEVSIDFNGYVDSGSVLINHPLDIIVDLLTNYLSKPYNIDNYNTSDWFLQKSAITETIQYSSHDEQPEVIDIIGDICTSLNGSFIIEADGRYNFKFRSASKSSVGNIRYWNILKKPKVVYNDKEYLSSAKIGYDPAWITTYKHIYDRTKEIDLVNKYRVYNERAIKTLLNNKTDAENYASEIIDAYGGIFPTYTIITDLSLIEFDLEDNIIAEVIEVNVTNDEYTTMKLEIIGKIINLNNYNITFTGRYISEYDPIVSELIKYTDFGDVDNFTDSGEIYNFTNE